MREGSRGAEGSNPEAVSGSILATQVVVRFVLCFLSPGAGRVIIVR